MIPGFREAKLSSNKKIKVRFFPGTKTESNVSLNYKSKKKPDNIIIHIGTNDAPCKNESALYEELKQIKDFIIAYHPTVRIFVSPAP